MAPKAAQKAAQKKNARQKRILMLLALPALGAVVYAYMTFSSMGQSSQPVQATPAAATTLASSIPSATPSGTPAAPVTPGVTAPPAGTLGSFVALGRKDPFNDHGPKANAAPTGSNKSGGSSKSGNGASKGGGKGKSGGGSQPKQPRVPLTGAVIQINGKKLALAIGNAFGSAPGLSGVSLFRLVKVAQRSAVIDVVGTKQQFTLHVLVPLTLQQNGGWRYTLILQPVGSAAPMTTVPTTTTTTSGN